MKNQCIKFSFCTHHTLLVHKVRCILTGQCLTQYASHFSMQARCDGGRTNSSNPKGPKTRKKLLKIRKGWNEKEELRDRSYLVLMAWRIVHQIFQNQLMKFEGENHSRAPKSQIQTEMVKMRGKTTFYVTIHVLQVKCQFLIHFFGMYMYF